MKTFTDTAGRTWTVSINVDAIKRVRSLLNVNLMEAVEGKLLERLHSDPVMLCDVLFVLCKPEADAKGISDEDFGRSMAGDAIEHATDAFLEELVDFFPTLRRGLLRKATAKLKAIQTRAVEVGHRRLEMAEIEVQKQLDAALTDTSGLPTAWPASSESTRAPEPSAN